MSQHLPTFFQQFIHTSRYARWLPEESRRETWEETIARYFDFFEEHLEQNVNFKLEKNLRDKLEQSILNLKVMPSMRCLMTAGPALKRENCAGYNCCFLAIDSIKSFDELLYLAANGVGVGFSVENKFISQLPIVSEELHPTDTTIVVADSKLGWAKSLRELISLLYSGHIPNYDTSKLRPAGAVLKTFGGRASGPGPLEDLFKFTINLFKKAAGRRLTSLECHDLCCKIGLAILSGGVRRTALISLSDLFDDRMRSAKSGEWWKENSQRSVSNNSFVINDKIEVGMFMKEWLALYESKSGERGIFSRVAAKKQVKKYNRRDDNYNFGLNPCFTGDTIVATADGRNGVSISQLAEEGRSIPVYSARRCLNNNKKYWVTEVKNAIAFKTGTKSIIEVILSDGSTFRCTHDHKIALASGGYIEAIGSLNHEIEGFYTRKHKNYRMINTISDAHKYQHRMIWEHHNGKKPEGYHIDHIVPNGEDYLNNLQLLEEDEHNKKTAYERLGSNNPVHNVVDKEKWIQNLSHASFMENNGRFSGVTDGDIISAAISLKEQGLNITHKNLHALNNKMPWSFSKNRFGGTIRNLRKIVDGELEYAAPVNNSYRENIEKKIEYKNPTVIDIIHTGELEDVYDLNVEDNHNFYIITDTKSTNYTDCSGVLVHNCGEVLLRSRQFCNLSEVVIRSTDNLDILLEKVEIATILGCFQSTLTNFKYLSKKFKENTEEERLLGVSLTGIMDNKLTNGKDKNLEKTLEILRLKVVETAKEWSEKLNINMPTACTVTKPSGTVSSLVNSGAGIHERFAPYYIRRVRQNKKDPVSQFMVDSGFLVEDDVSNKDYTQVFSFPMESPKDSIYRGDRTAIEQLEFWLKYKTHWCEHNPSITVSVKEEEWMEVGAWVWNHLEDITGVSFLPYSDHSYVQAPYEECNREQYIDMMNEMPKDINWMDLANYEEKDNTTSSQELSCTSGACDII